MADREAEKEKPTAAEPGVGAASIAGRTLAAPTQPSVLSSSKRGGEEEDREGERERDRTRTGNVGQNAEGRWKAPDFLAPIAQNAPFRSRRNGLPHILRPHQLLPICHRVGPLC